MKKELLLMSLMVSVGVAVTVTVAVFAVPCNKLKRSNGENISSACNAALAGVPCANYSNSNCSGEQMVSQTYDGADWDNMLYLGSTDGGASDHAIELTFVCGVVHNCEFSTEENQCIMGVEAISPTTGESIKRTRTHYDNDDCEALG
jgi:hypothetical protein